MRGGLSWTKLGADRETIPIRISIVTLNNTMAWLASIIQLPGILPQSMFLSLVTQNYYDCHHRSFEIMRFVDLWLWNGAAAAAGLITSSWRSVHETGSVEWRGKTTFESLGGPLPCLQKLLQWKLRSSCCHDTTLLKQENKRTPHVTALKSRREWVCIWPSNSYGLRIACLRQKQFSDCIERSSLKY